ncbi:hypothetical protein N6B72_10345 [Chryseobacterium soli]|uniref:hypothetical protein n=1 Tax=Chryseobacterium soli TaxID=445961 RepID=UPI002954660A|nr:hypothetical protein [Chryseobacterium soli]MDV7697319.1 hypothetical protein [Chryseobacterium soli]
MKHKIILAISCLILSLKVKAQQKIQPIYYIDYSYASKHVLRGGVEFILMDGGENQDKLFLGTGYGVVGDHGKMHGIPDLHLSYNIGTLLFIKAGSSFSHAYSVVGISLFNSCDIGIGYSKSYNNSNVKIQGFTAGITFRLTHKDNVYGKLKIGF